MAAAKRVLRYLCSTLSMGLVLGGRRPVVLTGHADTSWADDQATQRSSQGYSFSLGSGSVSWRSTRSSFVLGSSCEAEIYAGAMAAQELRWLTYLLTDLGEAPRSPPVLLCGDFVIHPELALLCLTVLVFLLPPCPTRLHLPCLARCPTRGQHAARDATRVRSCPHPARSSARAPRVLLPARPASRVHLCCPRRLAARARPAASAPCSPVPRTSCCPCALQPACASTGRVACCPRAPCCQRTLQPCAPRPARPSARALRVLQPMRACCPRALEPASPVARARPAARAP
ncbi:unnamed protein product [Closterium sp. NIES-54]